MAITLSVNDPFQIALPKGDAQKYASSSYSSYNSSAVVSAANDKVWSNAEVSQGLQFDSYYDYFFSGQDIIVLVDGTEDRQDLQLPIMQMGFNITQKKLPLYGYASYTYSAIARGTRLVSGSFMIATQYPGFMVDVLSHVATARLQSEAALEFAYPSPITADQDLIQKYWQDTMDPVVLQSNKPNIWSTHPPFDLIVTYGIQDVSINNQQVQWASQQFVSSLSEPTNAYFTDTNERIVTNYNAQKPNRITISNTELVAVDIGFAPDGSVCGENYQFIAQDIAIGN